MPHRAGNAFGAPGESPYHYKIDFSKPGAQEYIDSVVALFASWGVDFIKLDGVTPGSYSDDLSIDNRDDVAAWSKAIARSGRPIWLTVSWAGGQGLPGRVAEPIPMRAASTTTWNAKAAAPRSPTGRASRNAFATCRNWQDAAGASKGWNDLDTLDIGDGAHDGLSGGRETLGRHALGDGERAPVPGWRPHEAR